MELTNATWETIGTLDTDLAILPIGSTEQHGPHAPLGTDMLTASAVAEAGVERLDEQIPIGPPITVGVSAEHRQFPGTVWVSEDTFRAYVREAAESLSTHGFDRIVFVNGHGGNVAALREVAAELTRAEIAYTIPFTWFEAIDLDATAATTMGHAGPAETALLRAIDPALVDDDRLTAAADGASDRWGEWINGINFAYDSAAFTENGVVGDPTTTDKSDGQAILAAAARALAGVLEAISESDPRPPAPKRQQR